LLKQPTALGWGIGIPDLEVEILELMREMA
jgi:hypothetical protein